MIFFSQSRFFLAALILLLPGCLGSAVLFEDTGESDYGNLASVPDRPAPNNLASYKKEEKHLQQDYTQARNKNEEIRAEYSLKN